MTMDLHHISVLIWANLTEFRDSFSSGAMRYENGRWLRACHVIPQKDERWLVVLMDLLLSGS